MLAVLAEPSHDKATAIAYSYDSISLLTSIRSDSSLSYTPDDENRLVSIECSTGISPAIRIQVDFSLDYLSRHISKKVYSWSSSTND